MSRRFSITQLLNYQIRSSLRERYVLRWTAVDHVLYLHRVGGDVDHFVAAIHDLAFSGHENIFTEFQEYFFGLARRAGETVKLQRNWRRLRRWRKFVLILRMLCVRRARRDRLRDHY